MKLKITCLSDLHGETPLLPGGDLLIIAGDLTSNDTVPAWNTFYKWLKVQLYRKIVYIAGNHDNFLKQCMPSRLERDFLKNFDVEEEQDSHIEYLCDSFTTFEGLTIYGSSWTENFHGVNPHCKAFMTTSRQINTLFDLIPKYTDILVTHSPPFGIFDEVIDYYDHKLRPCGSEALLDKVEKCKPALHVFGHLHLNGCRTKQIGETLFVNAALMNEDYEARANIVNLEMEF